MKRTTNLDVIASLEAILTIGFKHGIVPLKQGVVYAKLHRGTLANRGGQFTCKHQGRGVKVEVK